MQVSGIERVPGEVAQVLAHLGRAGGAVEPDHVDAERLEGGEGRADLAAEQHRAGGLDGDLRDRRAGRRRRPPAPAARRRSRPWPAAGLARSRRGRRRRRRRPAPRPAAGRRRAGRRRWRGRATAAWCRARRSPSTKRGWSARRPGVGGLAGDARRPRCGSSRIRSRDAVLAEVGQVGAERVGLDAVDADREVGVVDGADDVGPGDVEDLVAALVALEVVERGVGRLQHRAHGAVGDDDALGEGTREGGRSGCSSAVIGRSARLTVRARDGRGPARA